MSRRILVSLMLLCSSVGAARADDSAAAPRQAEYEELIRQALQEFGAAHWTEARVLFQNAHVIYPNARTLRGLGLTCYEARNYVESVGFLERALASQEQPLTPSMREEAERLLSQARQFVSRAVIELSPPIAQLQVDDKPAQLDAQGTLRLDPGDHMIIARAEGFEPATHMINARDGEALRVVIHLNAIAGPVVVDTTPRRLPEPRSSPSTAQWLALAGSGAVAVAGGVFLGLYVADRSTVSAAEGKPYTPQLKAAHDRLPVFSTLGITLLSVGLVGAGAGVSWIVLEDKTDKRTAKLSVGLGQLQLSGSF